MKTVIEMALETGWKSYAGPVNAVYSFNESDLIKFAELVRADAIADAVEREREAIYDEWWSCVMSDLENGVKSLNEKAAVEWHKNYPAQSKMFPEWIEARSNT